MQKQEKQMAVWKEGSAEAQTHMWRYFALPEANSLPSW